MFSTLNRLFWFVIWFLGLVIWLLKLSLKLVLFLMFIDGLFYVISTLYRLCQYVVEKDSKQHRNQREFRVIENSYDDVNSICSEYSSRGSIQDFVITSWDKDYQVIWS